MMRSNRGRDLEWLLEGVCGMAVKQYQPKQSFSHSGFLSGFHFSLPPNLLPHRGYALSLGVYINPPQSKRRGEEEEEMCLSWIGDGNGNELNIVLTPEPKRQFYRVKVRVRKAAGSLDSFVTFDELPLKMRTWYSLSVAHANLGTGPWLRSEVVVCVRRMGEDKGRTGLIRKLLPYTQWTKRAEGVACLLCPPSARPPSDGVRMTYFKGSTTGVWLYRGAVTDEAAVQGVGEELRGGDECLRIIPGEQRDQRHPASQSPAPITRRASAPNSPVKNTSVPSPARRTTTLSPPRASAPRSMNAPSPAPLVHDSSVVRLPGTETSFSMSFTDALDCMGGLSCVFPLFAQIDQPTTIPAEDSIDYDCNPRLSLSLIKLVGDLVKSSSSSRSVMVERGGFELISYFLSSLDPRHMTSELLATIFDLEEASRQYPALHSSIVMELIANFKIWVYSPSEVQIELMDRMHASIQKSPQFAVCVRSEKSIQGLLESLHMLFWHSPPSIKRDNLHNSQTLPPVYRDRQRIHPVTKAVVGTRASGEDLNKIRNKVYSLVLTLLEVDREGKSKGVVEWVECRRGLGSIATADGGDDESGASSAERDPVTAPMWPITDEETRAIFHSLILADDNHDRKAKLELLGVLLHLSLNEINAIPLTRHILDGASQGFHFLMSMIGDVDEGIRIFVVLIFASISHNHYADPLTLYPPPQSPSRQPSKGMHGGGFNMYVPPPTLMRSMSGRALESLGVSSGLVQQSGSSSLYHSSSNLASSQQKLGGSFSESFSSSTHFYNPQATFAPVCASESVSSSSSVTFGSPSRKKVDSSAGASLASNAQKNIKNLGSSVSSFDNISSHSMYDTDSMQTPSSFASVIHVDPSRLSSLMPTILRWLDQRLEEFRPENVEMDENSEIGQLILDPDSTPPADDLVATAFVSIMFKTPTFAFYSLCLTMLESFGTPHNSKSVVRDAFNAFASKSKERIPQKRIADLLKSLEADIKARTSCNIRGSLDVEADVQSCELALRLTSGGHHFVAFDEFYAWYVTYFSNPDVDLSGVKNKRIIREASAFCQSVDYMRHIDIKQEVKINCLFNLLYVSQCHENCLKIASVGGWQEPLLRLLSTTVNITADGLRISDHVLQILMSIHVSMICSPNQSAASDAMGVLRDTMATFRIEGMHGRMERGKEWGMRLLSMICEELRVIKVKAKGNMDRAAGGGFDGNKRAPSNDTLNEIFGVALEYIFVPHQLGNSAMTDDGVTGGRLTSTYLALNTQFRLVNVLVDMVSSIEDDAPKKTTGGDILSDTRGLLRAIVTSLEQLGIADVNTTSMKERNFTKSLLARVSEISRERDSVDTQGGLYGSERVSMEPLPFGSLEGERLSSASNVRSLPGTPKRMKSNERSPSLPKRESLAPPAPLHLTKQPEELPDLPAPSVVHRMIQNLSTLLQKKFQKSEQAIFVIVRLADLLRRHSISRVQSDEPVGEGDSGDDENGDTVRLEMGLGFFGCNLPSKSIVLLLNDLVSWYSEMIWQDLQLLKPTEINSYIRERSESTEFPSYVSYAPEDQEARRQEEILQITSSKDPTLLAISNGLRVDSSLLDWSCWESAFGENLEFSLRQETEAVISRLDEFGLSDYFTAKTLKKLTSINTLQMSYVQDFSEDLREKVFRLRVKDERKIHEAVRLRVRKVLKGRQRWKGILEELTNERGPWGQRKDSNDEFDVLSFWILDESKNEQGLQTKFKRNLRGSQHKMASALSRGRTGIVGDSGPKADAAETPPSSLGSSESSWNAMGLMNDLKKYQRRATQLHEIGVDDMDDMDGLQDDSMSLNPETIDSRDKELSSAEDSLKGKGSGNGKGRGKGKGLKKSMQQSLTVKNANNEIGNSNSSSADTSSAKVKHSFKNCFLVTTSGRTKGEIEIKGSSPYTVSFFAAGKAFQDDDLTAYRDGGNSWAWVNEPTTSTSFDVSSLLTMRFRRYQQQPLSLELSFNDNNSCIFAFDSQKSCKEFHRVVRYVCRPPLLRPYLGMKPMQVLLKTKSSFNRKWITRAWVSRDISTFDYILALNEVAGRSFGDLTQYPVFPWILKNYDSETIDLKDPKNYRDFRWPMGAQLEEKRKQLNERYQSLASVYNPNEAEDIRDILPPFHHGTHFSAPGFVIWYLMRIEPFTSLHLQLQGGKFDKPDRLFKSISSAYKSCLSNQGDVKELIPEFFFMPEFLENSHALDLGQTQSNEIINDVQLPRWAKSTEDFIRIHREALESEHVSKNIHHWIDLVFGYKSRPPSIAGGTGGGQACVDSCNVFFHLTYNDAVDLKRMKEEDTRLYETYLKQIENFGQAPSILFLRPHPVRSLVAFDTLVWPLVSQLPGIKPEFSKLREKESVNIPNSIVSWELGCTGGSLVYIMERKDSDCLITVDNDGVMGYHTFQSVEEDVRTPFRFVQDEACLKAASLFATARRAWAEDVNNDGGYGGSNKVVLKPNFIGFGNDRPPSTKQGGRKMGVNHDKRLIGRSLKDVLGGKGVGLGGHQVAVFSQDNNPALLFSCGHLDNSIQCNDLTSGRCVKRLSEHRDLVTCLCLSEAKKEEGGGGHLVSGSRDCTVIVWKIDTGVGGTIGVGGVVITPHLKLYGHDDAITCISCVRELDLVVSASEDGSVIVHTLFGGRYTRTLGDGWGEGGEKERTDGIVGITWVGVSPKGNIATYSKQNRTLTMYSINGKKLRSRTDKHTLNAFAWSSDGSVLLAGGNLKLLLFFDARTLTLLEKIPHVVEFRSGGGEVGGRGAFLDGYCKETNAKPFDSPISSIRLCSAEDNLLVGLESGNMYCMNHEKGYLRKRLEKQLQSLGFF